MAVQVEEKIYYVRKLEEINSFLTGKQFQEHADFFSAYTESINFGNTELNADSHRLLWQLGKEEDLPFDGVPFYFLGQRNYKCKYRRWTTGRQEDGTSTITNKGCPAQLVMKEVIKFPEYLVTVNEKEKKKKMSKRVRSSMKEGKAKMERRIYIKVPNLSDHKNHQEEVKGKTITSQSNDVALPVREKINSLVLDGITSPSDISEHLYYYVEKILFQDEQPPEVSNKIFYPTVNVIECCVKKALLKKLQKLDQLDLRKLMTTWQEDGPEELMHFQPYLTYQHLVKLVNGEKEESSLYNNFISPAKPGYDQKMLFVHQTHWQRRLLMRYGSDFFFVDPAFRVARISVPVYFVVVKTNVDYQIVATIITQDEEQSGLFEGLEMIKHWNPSWHPTTAFVDLHTEDIKALEQIVEKVHINPSILEYRWSKWMTAPIYELSASERQELMTCLKGMSNATSEEEYLQRQHFLQATETWKENIQVRNWLNNCWLPEYQRWVKAFTSYKVRLFMTLNNGLDGRHFKNTQLTNLGERRLSMVVQSIRDEILPVKYHSYVMGNTLTKLPVSNEWLPKKLRFLEKYPPYVAAHCNEIINKVNLDDFIVTVNNPGSFIVASTDFEINAVVFRDPEQLLPLCTCKKWQATGLPCEHFFAIFVEFAYWQWYSFPREYKDSVFLVLDTEGIEFDSQMMVGSADSSSRSEVNQVEDNLESPKK